MSRSLRSWGDCYGYVLVATGRAELMVDDRLSPWDVAALVPIIEEAGGVFTDWQGQRGMGLDAVATNALLADEFRKVARGSRTGQRLEALHHGEPVRGAASPR